MQWRVVTLAPVPQKFSLEWERSGNGNVYFGGALKSPTLRVGLNVYKFENVRFDTEPVKWKVFSARLDAEA